eukprot:CAMPEP_0119304328 /NCGR_PEP_ID=MMETSP1333-20130426/5573_1 /TAXON_ID=418940 /ORGANISM="Scyphosphaera apsteinii, Strain RCC1455" /LENGTH=319 /DNA_ID=CAMNT_0007307185 /DNA_START=107 /DNA_END=1066 /DNA_ORIENTATION=+
MTTSSRVLRQHQMQSVHPVSPPANPAATEVQVTNDTLKLYSTDQLQEELRRRHAPALRCCDSEAAICDDALKRANEIEQSVAASERAERESKASEEPSAADEHKVRTTAGLTAAGLTARSVTSCGIAPAGREASEGRVEGNQDGISPQRDGAVKSRTPELKSFAAAAAAAAQAAAAAAAAAEAAGRGEGAAAGLTQPSADKTVVASNAMMAAIEASRRHKSDVVKSFLEKIDASTSSTREDVIRPSTNSSGTLALSVSNTQEDLPSSGTVQATLAQLKMKPSFLFARGDERAEPVKPVDHQSFRAITPTGAASPFSPTS